MSDAGQTERVRDAERTRAELLAVATEVFAEDGLFRRPSRRNRRAVPAPRNG